jgi:hypothetical protein
VGRGTAFQGPRRRLNCTLLARWEDGYADPWLLLTDLAPSAGTACWYGLRAWIEQGFKITKRGGWQWQRTRMTDPQRAARLWLAVAVATLWLLSVGGLAEDTLPVSTLLPLADADGPASRPRQATQLRLVSIFRQGWITILVALLNQRHLPQGRFVPEPWPQSSNDNSEELPSCVWLRKNPTSERRGRGEGATGRRHAVHPPILTFPHKGGRNPQTIRKGSHPNEICCNGSAPKSEGALSQSLPPPPISVTARHGAATPSIGQSFWRYWQLAQIKVARLRVEQQRRSKKGDQR